MADESQIAPVTLAPGIGENNEVPSLEPVRYTQQQQIDYENEQLAKKQLEQGNQVESLMNASSPTPLGKPVTPPVAETLSNLGKVEPQQLAAAGQALPQEQVPTAPGVTSIAGQINPQNPTGPSVTSVGGINLSDPAQMQKNVLDAYGQQQGANAAIAKAVQAKATADQTQFANAEKAYAKAELERAETKMKFDADFNGKMQSYEQSLADYKEAAGEKVMPGRILANMSTGQQVQAGIFMALSAYGAAISGQENQALKVINNAIDKDLEAQKFNLENKLKGARIGIEGSQYLMAQMRTKFGDDESAVLASRAAMLAMSQQQLNMNASKLDANTAGPKSQALNAQLEMQKQQVLAQLKQQQAQAYMMNKVSGGTSKNLSPAELQVMESVDKGFRDRWVQGFGSASNGEQAKKFTEYANEVQPAIDALDRIKAITKDFNKVTDLTKQAQLKSELAGLVGALRLPITGPGILTESERKMLENDVIGNPGKIFSLPSLQKARLMTIYNKLTNDLGKRGAIAGLPQDSFKKPNTTSKYFID